MNPARLLIPAIRADPDGRFERSVGAAEDALGRGVGGFILFGGESAAVRGLVARLRQASPHPLLIGSDLERGAGQQFSGATRLPPAAAIASLDDLDATRRAGFLTAVEARGLGVDWIFAPVADLDVEPRNPIVSTRAFGSDPRRVADQVTSWILGCHEGGALACAKHFPGHGRTIGDSHLTRDVVDADRESLDLDLLPFRAAAYAGVDSMMTAHVVYPALDPSGEVATLSPVILRDLLRGEIGYDGLVVSDALEMKGLSGAIGEGAAAVRALLAGCDVLLYPDSVEDVIGAIADAVGGGVLGADTVQRSIDRLEAAIAQVAGAPPGTAEPRESRRWSDGLALRSITVLRGDPRARSRPFLIDVDDDLGGPHSPPSRATFRRVLTEHGRLAASPEGTSVIALYSDPRASKGFAGLSDSAVERVATLCRAEPDARLVLFGHPRLAEALPDARNVLCAWGGEPNMQEAAARWILGAAAVDGRRGAAS